MKGKPKLSSIDNKPRRIAEGMVVVASRSRTLKELAFFYILKYYYSSGQIHNYSPYLLSLKTGYSRTKIKRHIDLFIKWRWCYKKGKDLFFKKNHDIVQRSKDIKVFCTDNEVYHFLTAILVDRKKRQCMFSLKARVDHRSKVRKGASMIGSDYNKLSSRLSKISRRNGAMLRDFIINSTTLSKSLGCARSTAIKRTKKAERAGILFIRRRRPKFITHCSREMSFEIRQRPHLKKKPCFWSEGILWKKQANEYNVPYLVWRRGIRLGTPANFSQSSAPKSTIHLSKTA